MLAQVLGNIPLLTIAEGSPGHVGATVKPTQADSKTQFVAVSMYCVFIGVDSKTKSSCATGYVSSELHDLVAKCKATGEGCT